VLRLSAYPAVSEGKKSLGDGGIDLRGGTSQPKKVGRREGSDHNTYKRQQGGGHDKEGVSCDAGDTRQPP